MSWLDRLLGRQRPSANIEVKEQHEAEKQEHQAKIAHADAVIRETGKFADRLRRIEDAYLKGDDVVGHIR